MRRLSAPAHRPPPLFDPQTPPLAWVCWVEAMGASSTLTRQMWRRFRATARPGELGAVIRAARRRDRPAVLAMLHAVTPKRLLDLLSHLAPEGQGERPREVRDVEAVILARARSPTAWR